MFSSNQSVQGNRLAIVAFIALVGGGCASDGAAWMDGGGADRPDVAEAADPCEGRLDGFHCDVQQGVEVSFECRDEAMVEASECPYGCGPMGCLDAPVEDPCAVAPSDGTFCGGNLGGIEGVLYTCQGGETVDTNTCPHGCGGETVGSPQACDPEPPPEDPPAPVDPCVNAPASGVFCGGEIAGTAGTVYTCEGGSTKETQVCGGSCDTGSCDDLGTVACIQPPSGPVTLGFQGCGGHAGLDIGLPYGTPLSAPVAGTVVGVQTGHGNCWGSGTDYFGACSTACWNSFNYVKVKADAGDPLLPGHDLYVYYLHVSAVAPGIEVGSHVAQGAPLAAVGDAGCVSGPNVEVQVVSVPNGQPAALGTCDSVDPSTRFCGALPNPSCGCQAGMDNFCGYGPNTPGCPMTQPGGYCDFNGDGGYADGNWLQGYYHYQAVCGG